MKKRFKIHITILMIIIFMIYPFNALTNNIVASADSNSIGNVNNTTESGIQITSDGAVGIQITSDGAVGIQITSDGAIGIQVPVPDVINTSQDLTNNDDSVQAKTTDAIQVTSDQAINVFKTDRYIIKYKEDIDKNTQKGFEDISSKAKKRFKNKIGNIKEIKTKNKRLRVLEVNNNLNSEDFASGLLNEMKDNNIDYIQPDYKIQLKSNDPYYDKQWALDYNTFSKNLNTNSIVDNKSSVVTSDVDINNPLMLKVIMDVCGVQVPPEEIMRIINTSKSPSSELSMLCGTEITYDGIKKIVDTLNELPKDTVSQANVDVNEVQSNTNDTKLYKPDINITSAWETSQGKGITIAEIDTGVDYNHEDLTQNIWTNSVEIAGNGIDDDNNGLIDDIHGWNYTDNTNNIFDNTNMSQDDHGTHIAGVIAALKDNSKGIIGVAPQVKIMPLKVFNNGVAYTSDIIQAIEYAASMGVKIVNCSFGTTEYNQALKDAMENSNILFVCAAGNDGVNIDNNPMYPAAYELNNIISVGSINQYGILSSFSNFGEKNVDVTAPGEDIYSTLPNNSYGLKSGTSMATAFVSGEAALILCKDTFLSAAQIKERIKTTSDRLSSLIGKVDGGYKINCYDAVSNILNDNIIKIDSSDNNSIQLNATTTTAISQSFKLLSQPTTYQRIAAGAYQNIFINKDGSVSAWGDNAYGQLGNGTTRGSNTPVKVIGIGNVLSVSGGTNHSIALKNDGTVWTWGSNSSGQLGDGTTTSRYIPTQVSGISNITAISAGNTFSVALKSDGTVWTWGYNSSGQLGDGTTVNKSSPVKVLGLSNITSIAAGDSHCLALKSDGTVWTWGYNTYGQLGDGTTNNRSVPAQVPGLNSIISIVCGGNHSVVLKIDNTVWAWGYNYYGQLGDATTVSKSIPVQLTKISNVTSIAAGYNHTLALKSDGTVWAWGYNYYGQLGNGTVSTKSSPTQVTGLTNVLSIACSYYQSVALKNDDSLQTWGDDTYGQLADGALLCRNKFSQVAGLSNTTTISAGGYHNLAIRSDKTVWAWGYNGSGQLGDGTTTNKNAPVQVLGLTNVIGVAAEKYHSIALKSDGTVWTWGYNLNGQLGDGTTINKTSPNQVPGLSNIISVNGGDNYCMALRSDGTVWSWGDNSYGQLGDGTTISRYSPVQMVGLSNVIAIAGGDLHSIVLKNDGTVWTCGSNAYGQLGDGTKVNESNFVQVTGLTNITSIAGSYNQCLALKDDGTVWAWGYNSYGQLGDGTTISKSSPVMVIGLTSIVKISEGRYHSTAIKSDGTAWSWGYNYNGQLSVGSWANSYTAVQMINISNASAISARLYYTLVLKNDGTIYSCGNNDRCQLGDGQRMVNRLLPGIVSWLQQSNIYTYTINCLPNKEYNIPLTGFNINDFDTSSFAIEYNKDELQLIDLCNYTKSYETTTGNILGTNITIAWFAPGKIIFKVNKSVQGGKSWSGTLNVVKFKSLKSSGTSIINYYN